MTSPDHEEPPTLASAHADWPKVLEWIEKQAQESIKARFVTCELISKESQTTLTVILAGVAGSATYATKIFEPGPASPLAVAAACICAYFVLVALCLVFLCMMFRAYPAQYQEPKNLMQPSYSLDELREAELRNIDQRITEAKEINDKRARRLNRIRVAIAISPFVFVAFFFAAKWLGCPAAYTQHSEWFGVVSNFVSNFAQG